MQNQPILFYSTRCTHSKQIIDTLKMLKKETLCRMFSIDGQTRDKLPPFLKSVPTLYVPETKDVYIGKDIYAYIAKPVTSRREVPVDQQPSVAAAKPTGSTVSVTSSQQAAPGDYQAWSFGTATGFSDSYSSWDAPGNYSAEDQLHYTFLGEPVLSPVQAEPATKQSYDGDKQGRNDDLKSRMETLQKQRDSEFTIPARK